MGAFSQTGRLGFDSCVSVPVLFNEIAGPRASRRNGQASTRCGTLPLHSPQLLHEWAWVHRGDEHEARRKTKCHIDPRGANEPVLQHFRRPSASRSDTPCGAATGTSARVPAPTLPAEQPRHAINLGRLDRLGEFQRREDSHKVLLQHRLPEAGDPIIIVVGARSSDLHRQKRWRS